MSANFPGIIHNTALQPLVQEHYTLAELAALTELLQHQGTLTFPTYPNGLFPAAVLTQQTQYTGYDAVWVRDTVHVAYAHYVTGSVATAVKAIQGLMQHFIGQIPTFTAALGGQVDLSDYYQRPAIKFVGATLSPLPEPWPHGQNDALGYFLWMYCRLAEAGDVSLDAESLAVLALFPPYLAAIQYWQDEDNGHWEEAPKVEASSIGAVIAGLQALLNLAKQRPEVAQSCPIDDIEGLIRPGQAALQAILPAECVQPAPQSRRYDAALLFLIYPLGLIQGSMAEQIVADVEQNLRGEYGIKRYLGDSYWCADYPDQLSLAERTGDFSQHLEERDRLLTPGEEAQWCLFDPILSIIYGQWFAERGNVYHRQQQIASLNRALGQITAEGGAAPAWRCPEAYYLCHGHYIPNHATPLLWTQANLLTALADLQTSLKS